MAIDRRITDIEYTDSTGAAVRMDDIIADIVVEEHHEDMLEITAHPVQQGSTISDHAFKRPAELTLRLGWSDSARADDAMTVVQIYEILLSMQENRALFTVDTGKRIYTSMICRSLSTTTTSKTEHALPITVRCKQIILVDATTFKLDPPNQKYPQQTSSPKNLGAVSAQKQ